MDAARHSVSFRCAESRYVAPSSMDERAGRHRRTAGVSQLRCPLRIGKLRHADLPPGYINWKRFKANQERLSGTVGGYGTSSADRTGAQGTSMLQGRVL